MISNHRAQIDQSVSDRATHGCPMLKYAFNKTRVTLPSKSGSTCSQIREMQTVCSLVA